MANFKSGDRVICIDKEPWFHIGRQEEHNNGPKYKQELVVKTTFEAMGYTLLTFAEYPSAFGSASFRKLANHTTRVSARDLVIQPVQESVKTPIAINSN